MERGMRGNSQLHFQLILFVLFEDVQKKIVN